MITVTGTYLHADDTTPGVGEVSFVPHIVAVHEDPAPHITVQEPITVTLDGSGAFSVDLIASDDPAWQADGNVPYLVTERVGGLRRSYSVELLPDGSTVDLADLLPLAESPDVGASHDHGRLIGLADDDHPQYLTEARADALYSDLAHAARHGSGGADAVTVAQSQVTGLGAALALLAPLASPTFTGTPAAPTAASASSTTQLATTAFVMAALGGADVSVTRPNTDDVLVKVGGQTVHYDSGWRDVSASVTNATLDSGGSLQMRRVNSTVSIRVLVGLLPTGTGLTSIIYTPPTGFRANGQTFITRGRRRSNPAVIYDFGIVGDFGVYAPVLPASSCLFTLNYITDDSIPTSLPGTLVSSAPA